MAKYTGPKCRHLLSSALHASLLGRTTTVVRNRGHIGNIGNLETGIIQGTYCRLTTRTRTLDLDFEVFQAVLLDHFTNAIGSDLRRERCTLARTAESGTTSGRPCQRIALAISNGHDRIVERCMNVGDTIHHILLDLLPRTSRCFSMF